MQSKGFLITGKFKFVKRKDRIFLETCHKENTREFNLEKT